ncbi:MAG TPA: AsmA family protein [Caulobacteraceae bacterium]|nr:AsmA family protein [Caulobacteraceae bacterium]
MTLAAHPPREAPPRRAAPPIRWRPVSILLGLALLILIVVAILFRWDWLRGPLARTISGRLHRPVEITGHLQVHPWSSTPTATVTGLVIGNPAWAPKKPMIQMPRLTISVRLWPLLEGKTILPLVEADSPRVDMLRDATGRETWQFGPPSAQNKPLKLPAINHLVIRDGRLDYRDERRRLFFNGVVSSSEEVGGAGHGRFVFDGRGSLNKALFIAHVTGGSLAKVDPTRPYDFTAHITAGPTRARLDGRIDHPFDFDAVSGHLALTGPDLADVYEVTGLALPNTPPYDLAAGFARRGDVFALRKIRGTVGRSDLAGAITVSKRKGRRFVDANLASAHLRLADLVAVIGGAPRHPAGQPLSPMEKVVAAKLTAEHRLLPDTRLDASRLKAMDARIVYRAAAIDAGRTPMHDLSLSGLLDRGDLVVDPLDVGFAHGRLGGSFEIDARPKVQRDSLDLRFSGVALQDLVHSKSGHPPAEGQLFARAHLTSTGDSVRAAAAHANGTVSLAVPGGALRQSFVELTGIDVAKSFLLLISNNKQDTSLRCAVADFRARDGVLQATQILADTSVVQVHGAGDIDLRDERMALKFQGKPKKFRLLRLDAPITLTGPIEHPKPGVDIVKAAPQVLGSVALGVLAAPAVAILPFIAPGLAKNADCSALLAHQPAAPARR